MGQIGLKPALHLTQSQDLNRTQYVSWLVSTFFGRDNKWLGSGRLMVQIQHDFIFTTCALQLISCESARILLNVACFNQSNHPSFCVARATPRWRYFEGLGWIGFRPFKVIDTGDFCEFRAEWSSQVVTSPALVMLICVSRWIRRLWKHFSRPDAISTNPENRLWHHSRNTCTIVRWSFRNVSGGASCSACSHLVPLNVYVTLCDLRLPLLWTWHSWIAVEVTVCTYR